MEGEEAKTEEADTSNSGNGNRETKTLKPQPVNGWARFIYSFG